MELRDYQSRDISLIVGQIAPGLRLMYQLPTGGGKTLIATEIARRSLAQSPSRRLAWLTHRRELEKQSRASLLRAGIEPRKLRVLSPARLASQIKTGKIKPHQYDLMIIDEAHHSAARSWASVITAWPGAIVGTSATPWRLSKREGLDDLYDKMLEGPTKGELIRRGFLAPSLVKNPPDLARLKGYGRNTAGDYSVAETMRKAPRGLLIEYGINWLLDWSRIYRRRLKTLIYAISVEHAEALAHYGRSRGLKIETLHAKSGVKKREKVVQDYAEGRLDAIANVAILTEGFDVPDTDCVVCLRPTQSLALWLQMVGRANRMAEGKKNALILDGTDNTETLGHPDIERKWSLRPRTDAPAESERPAPARACPDLRCETLNPSGAKTCVECRTPFGLDCPVCGWVFGVGSGPEFRMPEQDSLGRCERCSLVAQQRRFGYTVPDDKSFRGLFSPRPSGNLAFRDPNANLTFWVRPARKGRPARAGAYLSDPDLAEFLPRGVRAAKKTPGQNARLLFGGLSSIEGPSEDALIERLRQRVYRPALSALAPPEVLYREEEPDPKTPNHKADKEPMIK